MRWQKLLHASRSSLGISPACSRKSTSILCCAAATDVLLWTRWSCRSLRLIADASLMFSVFVYIVRCRDGSYYVGSARRDLDRRIAEHNAGTYGGYTARRRPVELVLSCEFQQITDAISAERQIKGWSRAKKEALIQGDEAMLVLLARRRTPFSVKRQDQLA